jgi:hypothetical protein
MAEAPCICIVPATIVLCIVPGIMVLYIAQDILVICIALVMAMVMGWDKGCASPRDISIQDISRPWDILREMLVREPVSSKMRF